MNKRRIIIVACLVCLALWGSGLILFAQRISAQTPDSPKQHTDALVVLTGGSLRLETAFGLYKQQAANALFISGVHKDVDLNELFKRHEIDPAQLGSQIVLDHKAANTEQNAEQTARWMEKNGFTSLRIVTAAYHMPRSLVEFERRLPRETTIAIHPVFPANVKHRRWWKWPGTFSLIFHEYHKYLAAVVRSAFV